jgi:AcrR family transcriptional regulator
VTAVTASPTSSRPAAPRGLRERKKLRTRAAILDAALDLFEEQGYEATTIDQIAERAEVAPATLFRYFPSKAELLVGGNNETLPAIVQAVLDRPADDDGMAAIRHAIVEQWVPAVDPVTTARRARIVATSDLLSGLSYHRGQAWLTQLSAALAQREGAAPGDERCVLVTRMAMAAMASGVEGWIDDGFEGDLGEAISASFDLARRVFADLAPSSRARPGPRRATAAGTTNRAGRRTG